MDEIERKNKVDEKHIININFEFIEYEELRDLKNFLHLLL